MATGSRIAVSLFLAVFFAAGAFGVVYFARSAWQGIATRSWTATECVIDECLVDGPATSSRTPTLQVRYHYRFGGATHESTRIRRGGRWGSDTTADLVQFTQRHPAGSTMTCYVDPNQPDEAVVVRGSWSTLLFALFPMIFVAIGAGGIFGVWRSAAPATDQPISNRATGSRRRVFLGVFFSVFLLFGGGMTFAFLVHPLLQILAAREWASVPCEILTSGVASHRGDHGSTYSVELTYRYSVDGRSYIGARYHFATGSSSGYEGKAAIVGRLPVGAHTVCYVNPADPTDAVLERGLTGDLGFGAIPLVFFAIGAAGVGWAIFGGRKGSATGTAATSTMRSLVRDAGPIVLKPAMSPRTKFFGYVFAMLFWNGIVSVFVGVVVHDWAKGDHHWGLMVFLTPFVLVGIVLIGAAGKQFLALFNPRVRLVMSRSSVALGDTLDLRWEVTGNASRLKRLRLYAEGREEVTYRRGTTTSTDRRVFATWPLADVLAPATNLPGAVKLRISADTMHTFKAPNNRILWTVQVRGEIPRWPDVEDEFPLQVNPRPPSA